MTQNRLDTRKKHRIEMTEREQALISGVEEVISFDETCVVLRTVCGVMAVDGKDMRVVSLDTDTGDIVLSGMIDGVIYPEAKQKSGLFAKRKPK